MENALKQLKLVISIILLVLLATFTIQNTEAVELSFLHWTFQSRRVVVIGISLFTGLVIGWLLGRFRH